jgi:hypothetical protein
MVDFRPLLFINALALMLLVTAGFASVRGEAELATVNNNAPARNITAAVAPTTHAAQTDKITDRQPVSAVEPKPVKKPAVSVVQAEPFYVAPIPTDAVTLAVAEPLPAISKTVKPASAPVITPAPVTTALPTTGNLTLRSNVADDQVTINGKPYGPTRLDLELNPGQYDVTISKNGFKPWTQTVALQPGSDVTLVGELVAYTTVNFQKGTWVGGITTGDGTYEDNDGLRYEGHFIDGKFHGKGTAWYPDGSRYEGDWANGEREGEGNWRSADGSRYSGEFRANQFNGKGTLTVNTGDILTGHWKDGRLNGHGSLTTADGMLYVGGFRDNDFHGQGSLTYPDGRHYEGDFSNGAFNGTGSEVFADGKKYEGEYIEGKFHGKGLLRNPNGSSIEATFRHGEPYGQVRLTTAAGEVFTARTTEPGVCYREKSYRATQCPELEGW